ncbi:MAG TPA: glycosyltransferase family 2 protein [Candidatus Hydrothermia bacterium]|nr:glycosyltransferase family 2 protein [Candidatus Hydrothermia bacterium]
MKVSFIIASRNSSKTIAQTLSSFKRQTSMNFEVIVVDNSYDETPRILEEYKNGDLSNHLVYVKSNDKCASEGRNIGLNYASGDYVVFLDADDLVHPCLVEDIVEVGKNLRPEILIWDFEIIYPKDLVKKRFIEKYHKIQCKDKRVDFPIVGAEILKESYIDRQGWIWIGNIAYSRKYLDKQNIKFPEEFVIGEDPNFSFKLLCTASKCARIHSTLAYYFQAPGSMTRRYNPRFADQFYAFIDMAEFSSHLYRYSGIQIYKDLENSLKNEWVISAFVTLLVSNFLMLSKEVGCNKARAFICANLKEKYPSLKGIIKDSLKTVSRRRQYLLYKPISELLLREPDTISLLFISKSVMLLKKLGNVYKSIK